MGLKEQATRFNEWFFKGRIDKKIAENTRIDSLTNEYDTKKVWKIAN